MTKTQEKDAAVQEEWRRLHKELSAVIRAEFPVGTRVRYRLGLNWICGVVDEMPFWDHFDELNIKNTKTGNSRNVRAKELEFDNDNDNADADADEAKKAA